jgi:hypothetical protein
LIERLPRTAAGKPRVDPAALSRDASTGSGAGRAIAVLGWEGSATQLVELVECPFDGDGVGEV